MLRAVVSLHAASVVSFCMSASGTEGLPRGDEGFQFHHSSQEDTQGSRGEECRLGGGAYRHTARATLASFAAVEGCGQPGIQDGGSPRHQHRSRAGPQGEFVYVASDDREANTFDSTICGMVVLKLSTICTRLVAWLFASRSYAGLMQTQ